MEIFTSLKPSLVAQTGWDPGEFKGDAGGDRQTEYMAACDRLCLDGAVCDGRMSERASLFMCRAGTLEERVRVFSSRALPSG